MALNDQALLASGVDPAAVATLAADRPAFQANQLAAELDKLGDSVVSPEDKLTADLDALGGPVVSPATAPPDLNTQLASLGDQEVNPLDIFSDEALISDKSFSPKEHYIQKGGAAAFDAKAAARLGRIRKGQEAGRSVVGTVASQLGNIIPAVPKLIYNVGKGIASGLETGIVTPLVGTFAPEGIAREYVDESERRGAESLAGAVAETAGLVKGVGSLGKYVARKTGLAKDWSKMTDEEAFRAIIDEGEGEREVRSMAQGNIPALAPTFEALAAEGRPIRPEKVQEAAEHGGVGWLAFGAGIKLGGTAARGVAAQAKAALPASVLTAVQKAEQLAALRTAREAALKAQQVGPKNAATEAALKTAQENFQAAEAAVSESSIANAADLVNRARSALSSVSETVGQGIVGRPIQLAGAAAEGLAKIVTKTPRIYAYGGAIAGLFVNPLTAIAGLAAKELVAPLAQRAGAAVKGYGKAVAEGQARRTLAMLGGVKDVATTSLSQYPLDYAFSVGLSDTEQEARAAAPIATALGVLPGVGKGVRRIVTGALITPKSEGVKFKASPAYGENKVLDTAHATAMKTVDVKAAAQVNWVRELARKMGGRVYLMPDTATFEATLREVWKQQNPGAEITPAIAAQFKQAADQQGYAWGNFKGADGELQPTVFIKNAEAAVHEMGHILENVLPEAVNARLDEQILSRLSPENIEAAGSYYARRLGRTEPWREVLSEPNPELTPEQYLAREMRAENLGVALKNRGEAFVTSPGMYRWLVQSVAKIGDLQGIPLTQSEALGFPVFADVMIKGEKAARKITTDEVGQELIQARDVRLRAEQKAARPAEAVKGEALANELAARDPTQAEILRKFSNGVSTGQALKIDYRSAPGEPAGSPNISREVRREIVEIFRDMPESERSLWEKISIAYGFEATKNKGIQILTYSSEVLAANAHKMARYLSDAGLQHRSPFEIDATTKSFTPESWRKLYEVVQTFAANQRAGGTGSGVPLKLPANAAEMRVSVPALNEAALIRIPQAEADFINILFHLPPPETPRVSRKGGTPSNVVSQRIARENEPVIGLRVVEPGRARSEKEFKGFPGMRIQEVNPLRAEFEAAATKDIPFPSLIETNQRLNLEHVADATIVPEVTAALPVTDTLRAGFLPKEWKIVGQKGGLKAETTVKAADETAARKLATAQGFRVEKASPVSPPEGALGQFLPGDAKVRGEEISKMTTEEFSTAARGWTNGLTGEARKIGLELKSKEELDSLRQFSANAQAAFKIAMARKDMDTAMLEANKAQLFNEAIQSATGTGANGEALRAALGEAYSPPFPLTESPK